MQFLLRGDPYSFPICHILLGDGIILEEPLQKQDTPPPSMQSGNLIISSPQVVLVFFFALWAEISYCTKAHTYEQKVRGWKEYFQDDDEEEEDEANVGQVKKEK